MKKKFLVSVEAEIEIYIGPKIDNFDAKTAAMRIAEIRLNHLPSLPFDMNKFHVVDAEEI